MKQKHILWGMLALFAASCTNDEMNEVAEMKQNGIQVTADFGTDTRIDFSEEGNVTHVFWNEGDQITIYDEAQGGLDYQVASVSNGGATANFSAINAGLQETAEGATVNAIYPALPVVDGIVKLPNTNVWNEDRLIPYATASGSISDSKLGLSFFHEFAYLKLTLNAETVANSNAQTIHAVYLTTTQDPAPLSSVNGTYDIINNSVSYQDAEGANSIHFSLNEPFTATGDVEKVIYIPILPQSAGETLTLSILHHDDYGVCDTLLTVSKQVPESGFTYGNVYTYTPKQSFTRDENNTITVFESGVLSQAITDEEKGALTSLKVVGPLNGDDILFIREMAGVDVNGYATEGVLTYLDISEATIVEGGDYYCYQYSPVIGPQTHFYTSNDVIGDHMFDSTILQQVLLPKSVTSIGSYAFRYCSSLTSIAIPDGVTSIGSYAFRDCSSLTSITIPDGVISIGNYAFYGCSLLTSITIPNGVTSIDNAFYNCSSLTSITIPDSVTSIDGAFSGCSSLTSINIPDGVTEIGNYTFRDCSSLTSISIPNGVTWIGNQAFDGCSFLTSINIPDGVTSIEGNAFRGCSSLPSINIPDGVIEISDYAFGGCSSLTEVYISDLSAWCRIDFGYTSANPLCNGGKLYLNNVVITELVIPNDITEIKRCAFYTCSSFTSVTIPDGVTSIGDYAFYKSPSLTSVTIGNGVTSIGNYAFNGCSSLAKVTIGNGVTSISGSAFHSCSSLTDVYISDLSAWCKIDFEYDSSNPLYYGRGKLYLNNVEVTELVIPDDITEIKNYAFSGCSSLTSINIPDDVTLIGEFAFGNCSSLASLTLGSGLTSIGGSAFSGCSSLPSINIPDGVTEMGDGVFDGCSSLTSVTLGSGLTSISDEAFYDCSSLTSITIPDGIVEIGYRSFQYCSSLTSVILGSGLTSIDTRAFAGCSLSEVTCKATTPPTLDSRLGSDYYVFSTTSSAILYVPTGCSTAYSESDWAQYFTTIEEK